MSDLHLILGDQLSHSISSLQNAKKNSAVILMCEVDQEATYVKHHPKKIVLLFSAMRHFAAELRKKGFTVVYTTIDDANNTGSFPGEIKRQYDKQPFQQLIVTEPGEYRVLEMLQSTAHALTLSLDIRPDNRFYCSLDAFADWAAQRKQISMEFFYRKMRSDHHILMDDGKPIGGMWNFDKQNRKSAPPGLTIPAPTQFSIDQTTQAVIDQVEQRYPDHFGDIRPFHYAVTRTQALKVLHAFIQERLIHFGDYQDAMLTDQPWMFHAHISFYLNCGLLLPRECVDAAETAYHQNHAPLAAVEGFIRQIIGWREYVRGIYWLKMPAYKQLNFFKANRPLPDFYWGHTTKLHCVSQSVAQTKQHAYAHHIQRLMILGNFALLAGIDPAAVNEWYLLVYADAYEWVELPNVSGMVLFADGGYLASKPYAAGGNYIRKMSNYCQSCHYRVEEKTGPTACPFNYLYWNFIDQHQDTLAHNHRMRMILSTLKKMPEEKLRAIRQSAQLFLQKINTPQ